eukprot:GILJ01006656.1.p1 GENE.GILJ01006656.1~~GILJ01006656.1.p1  ORF type:complete len:175 (+),score=18.05 GILJ01006656.1:697-1221(+)
MPNPNFQSTNHFVALSSIQSPQIFIKINTKRFKCRLNQESARPYQQFAQAIGVLRFLPLPLSFSLSLPSLFLLTLSSLLSLDFLSRSLSPSLFLSPLSFSLFSFCLSPSRSSLFRLPFALCLFPFVSNKTDEHKQHEFFSPIELLSNVHPSSPKTPKHAPTITLNHIHKTHRSP